MLKADYRDCLDLSGAIAESIEGYESGNPYEGDDLPTDCIIPHLIPVVGELEALRAFAKRVSEQWLTDEHEDEFPVAERDYEGGWDALVSDARQLLADIAAPDPRAS